MLAVIPSEVMVTFERPSCAPARSWISFTLGPCALQVAGRNAWAGHVAIPSISQLKERSGKE